MVKFSLIEQLTSYWIRTFPNRSGEDWIQNRMSEDVGYHAEEGKIAVLRACRGTDPKVCENDLMYHSGLSCERASIRSDQTGVSLSRKYAVNAV